MKQPRLSRRQWLQTLGGAALITGLSRLNSIAQQNTPDYKALVCIFLSGGNDGHNTIIPLTQSEYDIYQMARGNLALPDNNGPLLQISTPGGTPYGLNPGLQAIHPLWNQKKLAVIANTGVLVEPVTRAEVTAHSKPLPTNLFSHSDQIQQMQSGYPSTSGGSGWGGRTVDQLVAANGNSSFTSAISIAGPALFCSGSNIQSASLLPGFNLDISGMNLWPQSAATARKAGLQQLFELDSGLAMVQAANKVRKDAIALNSLLTGASATITTPFPGTSLGVQLQQVARIIKLRGATGMNRQVFFCSLGGFDTHGSQAWQHWDLLRQLSEAMAAFYQATEEMGLADKVTTFTLSDFGRSLQPSGSGSDHGWGNHHLILGGAVHGGDVYGMFPTLALGGPNDSGTRGTLIPTTGLDQYGATLAQWFGVPPEDLPTVFPNLIKFADHNLGFMG